MHIRCIYCIRVFIGITQGLECTIDKFWEKSRVNVYVLRLRNQNDINQILEINSAINQKGYISQIKVSCQIREVISANPKVLRSKGEHRQSWRVICAINKTQAIVAHQAFATARLILLTAKAQRTTKELRRPEQEISSWKILRLRLIVGFEPRGRSSNIDEDEKSWRRRSG